MVNGLLIPIWLILMVIIWLMMVNDFISSPLFSIGKRSLNHLIIQLRYFGKIKLIGKLIMTYLVGD